VHGLALLLLAVTLVTILITVLRLHAFLALIVTAAVTAFLSSTLPASKVMASVAGHFGTVCARIGIVIALAAFIGECMLHSGAAEKISRVVLRLLGERRASWSLLITGHVLGIPVFFDTVFYLLIPVARSLRARAGRNYLLFVLSIVAGGITAHCLIPPTPGPLAMAVSLGIPLPVMFLVGAGVALPMAFTGWLFAVWWDRKVPVPFRDTTVSVAELEVMARRSDEALPAFPWSIAPIAAPVLLIASGSFAKVGTLPPKLRNCLETLGDPNLALLVAAAIALALISRRGANRQQAADVARRAFSGAGGIILITAAGGSLGGVLGDVGVGTSLAELGQSLGLPWLLLGYLLSALFKVAQGSSTVAMMTTASMLAPAVVASPPPYPTVLLATAIGAGSLLGEWMNDSAFWVYQQMAGLTEAETLRTLSPLLGIMSLAGLVVSSFWAVLWTIVAA